MSEKGLVYFCQSCGNESVKWMGKCPWCGEWNSFVSQPRLSKSKSGKPGAIVDQILSLPSDAQHEYVPDAKHGSVPINQIPQQDEIRICTQDEEFDRVLGGGIVLGSVVLIAGEPGIGKSTLLLQLALELSQLRVLYVSGEESARQVKLRASRLTHRNAHVHLFTQTCTTDIFTECSVFRPQLLVIDSIQTLHSAYIDTTPGSILQIKECAAELQRYAKKTQVPVLLIGHINKEGTIAGPKVLEHMVDVLLQFEGERQNSFRILRSLKNRFGSCTEIGIYDMQADGLHKVENPSELFLSSHSSGFTGTAVGCVIGGMRPLFVEVQALVCHAVYGTPQRTVKGFDLKKLQLLLAVLDKHCGFSFGTKDVFMNIVGGLKSDNPSLDLAVVCALISSYKDFPLPPQTCFIGEIGLSGELRAVNKMEQYVNEAEKLGFTQLLTARVNQPVPDKLALRVHYLSGVNDAYTHIMGMQRGVN